MSLFKPSPFAPSRPIVHSPQASPGMMAHPVATPRQNQFAPRVVAAPPDGTKPIVVGILEPQTNAFGGLGFLFLSLYIFSYYSLGSELGIVLLGIKPYITMVAGPLAIICALSTGLWTRVWDHRAGRAYVAFGAWLILGLPFALYKTGAFDTLYEFIPKQFAIVFMIVGLAQGFNRTMALAKILTLSALLLFGVSLKLAGSVLGRFMIANTSLSNPNDLATHCLFLVPFCLLVATNCKGLWRVLAVAGGLLMIYLMIQTGSRGGLLGALGLTLALFWRSSRGQKVFLFGALVIALVGSLAAAPEALIARYKTFFSTGQETDSDLLAASGSADSRWLLFLKSLEVTMYHPIFGVGAGCFQVDQENTAKSMGVKSAFLETHNAYTQASSEGGIPAFVFFTATLIACIKSASRVQDRTKGVPGLEPIAAVAFCLFILLWGFSVNIVFSHLAYKFYVPTVAGMTITLFLTANAELVRRGLAPISLK